ncbi:MAG: putative capsid protein [Cressdnaviricota sp.]|nr:MAG: putative capsid protein [Cressdnaviricota sp.]
MPRRNKRKRGRKGGRVNRRPRKKRRVTKKLVKKIVKKAVKASRPQTYTTRVMPTPNSENQGGAYALDGVITNMFAIQTDPGTHVSPLYRIPQHKPSVTGGEIHGYRQSDKCWVKGLRVSGKLYLPAVSPNDAVTVTMRIWRYRRPHSATQGTIISELPNPAFHNDLNGCSPSIDQIASMKGAITLAKKTLFLQATGRSMGRYYNFNLSKFFKRPQKQVFDEADEDGTNPLNDTYWFSIWSDVERTAADRVTCCYQARTYYYTE